MLPRVGDKRKIRNMDIAVTVPTAASAPVAPTCSLTHMGKKKETIPIEKMVLAKS
jgi:hypothetical protein